MDGGQQTMDDEMGHSSDGQTESAADSALPENKRVPKSESHDYERLNGASGRAVFFRPQRMSLADLHPLKVRVDAWMAGAPHALELVDLSQNGVGARLLGDAPSLVVGQPLERLVVNVNDVAFYDGAATVAAIRATASNSAPDRVLGLSLVDRLIDVDQIKYVRDVHRWDEQHSAPLNSAGAPWAEAGTHTRFKAELLDLRLYLDETKAHLDELEKTLPWEILHGKAGSAAQDALIALTTRDLRPEFDRRVGTLFELSRHLPEEENKALVTCSRRTVQSHFLTAPWLDRAWQKPLGYAGDYEVMNYMYRCQFEGATLFGKAMTWASLHAPSPTAVRTRKEMCKDLLRKALRSAPADPTEPVRVLSIASGPAQEMFELLQEEAHLERPLEIILFDQDPGALAFAHRRLHHLIERRWAGRVKIIFLHDTIRRLGAGLTVLGDLGPMDMILSSGLYDYLPDAFAIKLTRALYALLRQRGFAAIGNMIYANPNRWVMEHLLDWWLIFRSEDEMRWFASQAAPEARIGIRYEETKINPFVLLHRD